MNQDALHERGLEAIMDVQMPEEVGPTAASGASMDDRIKQKLQIALAPVVLQVLNESERHASHAGSPGTGESHYRVSIVSEAFAGKNRLERHRLVHALLAEELAGGVHALAISAKAPGEVG